MTLSSNIVGELNFLSWIHLNMTTYLIILQVGQLRAMCTDFFAIDWTFDHLEPLNPHLSKNTEFDPEWSSINLDIRCLQSLYSYQ